MGPRDLLLQACKGEVGGALGRTHDGLVNPKDPENPSSWGHKGMRKWFRTQHRVIAVNGNEEETNAGTLCFAVWEVARLQTHIMHGNGKESARH